MKSLKIELIEDEIIKIKIFLLHKKYKLMDASTELELRMILGLQFMEDT